MYVDTGTACAAAEPLLWEYGLLCSWFVLACLVVQSEVNGIALCQLDRS